MKNPLSQASLARALGLSPPAVTKLKKLGMPTSSVQAARAWREQHQSVARRKPEPAPAVTPAVADFNASRALREQSEAGIATLQLGALNATLLERAAVERGTFAAARGLRDAFAGAAGAIAAAAAGQPAAEVERVVRAAHRQLLDDFVAELGRMIATPAEPAPAVGPAPPV